MPLNYSRRSVLQLGGTSLVVLCGGCSAFASSGAVTVGLVNSTEQPHIVHVEIRRDDTVVWSQRADIPPDRGDPPLDDGTVETTHALTEVTDGTRFDVRAWIHEQQHVESEPLVINSTRESPDDYITVRINDDSDGDVWVAITA